MHEIVGRGIIKRTFALWQALGFHVTPNHYYEPIPDTRLLKEALWSTHSELVGIDMNEPGQIKLLERFVAEFKAEYDLFPSFPSATAHAFYVENGVFLGGDAEVLYCMLRHFKPRRFIEVGSGYSTLLSAQALCKNREEDESFACEFISIDPCPPGMLEASVPGLSRLIRKPIQEIPISELTCLSANDILFIDSSHVLRVGGDVQLEYLEVLPRLPIGVIVHIHDVFLPMDYPREWFLERHRFWNEQYLLQAFLTFNDSFEILCAVSYLHVRHPDKLADAFQTYRRDERWQGRRCLPGSFWMRRVR